MKPSGDATHRPTAVDPKQFRAQATGIGQQREASLYTGSMRAQRVVDMTDPACMAPVPENEGFPARTPEVPMINIALLKRGRGSL